MPQKKLGPSAEDLEQGLLTDIHIDSSKTSNRAMCREISDPSSRPRMKEAGPLPLGQIITNFPTQSLGDIPSATRTSQLPAQFFPTFKATNKPTYPTTRYLVTEPCSSKHQLRAEQREASCSR
ncbi:hypothetical protein Nepgr_030192 [Nepenthes gracilis]|uniref:Uncharacterized protein n=1 Tax=Nepenthes gracilis TaxID=150966 RepID=A0AAD3Y5U5_NEPGR|nr:hypothetical protein Nepgr_030192 [Nepenthes gracilis]